MSSIDELTEYFKKFPGIGPRQAGRFVYFLLNQQPEYVNGLITKIKNLEKEISTCADCFQYFITNSNQSLICPICAGKNRDRSKLLVVASDVDLKTIEKSGTYDGLYFVLGGTVPIMTTEPEKKIRLRSLTKKVARDVDEIKEIIIALSANPEGENTADLVRTYLKNVCDENKIKISVLGRGLSTGSEIEYSDPQTLKNALNNRF
jgi:recombination protein RecR